MENKSVVLLVEDNEKLNESNRRALELKGYGVLTALTLREAREHLKNCAPDVILLDVMLPDGDGIDFCGEIRGEVTSHILFLTAKTEHEEKIKGLNFGGDDYITKPFKLEEMLARVGAAIRRRNIDVSAKTLTKGLLSLDLVAGQAFLDGQDMVLTPKEFAVLLILVQNEGKIINTETIYEKVWGRSVLNDRYTVKNTVYRLRKKLELAGYDIEMVYGQGYVFKKK